MPLVSFLSPSQAQQNPTPIIFIYDISDSMWRQLENSTKIEIARSVLGETLENLPVEQSIDLFAYGHRREKDCTDIGFMVGIDNQGKSKFVGATQSIRTLGRTLLVVSARIVFVDLKSSNQIAMVILITDGMESCGGDLCAVVSQAKAMGISFRLHIVGFGLKAEETAAL